MPLDVGNEMNQDCENEKYKINMQL